ncbi:MAG: tryptophan-rich sensory protein [Methanoregula sp.]|nr:tryptophan-rich sensory protein [Methanoregula sp.]
MENKVVKLVISFGICLIAGYFNSLYALPLVPSWFASLNKPGFIPPDPFFVPIGLVVYLLLGLSLYFIWNSGTGNYKEKQFCLFLFISSLILNVLWVYTFFGLRSPFTGLMVILFLFAGLMSTIYQTLRVSFGATLLLLPYLVILFVAAYANYMIVVMNPNLPLF